MDQEVDRLSLIHAIGMIAVGPLVAFLDIIITGSPSHWFYSKNTTILETILFCLSTLYYIFDIFRLSRSPRTVMKNGLCVHHVLCLAGLLPVVIYGEDGHILLLGIIIGELSNPPRLLAQRYDFCRQITLPMFLICRIACTAFLKSVFPNIQLLTTKISAIGLLVLSVVAIFYSMHIQSTVIVGQRQRQNNTNSWPKP